MRKKYIKMVAQNPKDRSTIEEILNDEPWLKDVKMPEQEAKEKLKEIYEIIHDSDKVCVYAEKIIEDGEYITKDIKGYNHFKELSDLRPKKISKDRIHINPYLKIKGSLQTDDFMDLLFWKILNKFGNDVCYVDPSENSLKLEITFNYPEIKRDLDIIEIDDCKIEIELFEYEDGNYLIEFLRTGRHYPSFYYHVLKIKDIITGNAEDKI